MIELTQETVEAALNRAADDIINAATLAETGVVDALNLLVNVTGWRLFHNPDADLAEAIENQYPDTKQQLQEDWDQAVQDYARQHSMSVEDAEAEMRTGDMLCDGEPPFDLTGHVLGWIES